MPYLPAPIGSRSVGPAADFTDALSSAAAYARAEKAQATRRAYAADWADFETWCGARGVEALPQSDDEIRRAPAVAAAYVAALADAGLKASTINRRVAALAHVYRAHGLEPPAAAEAVKSVLRGIRRRLGTAPARKAPATAKALKSMIRLIPDTLRGKRDRALLLLGFAAAMRRSELVELTVEDIERAPEGVVIHVRRSKTDQEGEGHEIAVPRGARLGIVDALDAWLAASAIRKGPVFRSVGKGGHVSVEPLSGRSVADIVKRWAEAAKLDPRLFSGHSLRSGFVTTALDSGADLLNVMRVTRHRSVDTVKVYDRRALWKNHAGKGFL